MIINIYNKQNYNTILLGVTFPGLPSGKSQIDLFWTCVDTNPGPIFAGIEKIIL